MPTTQTSVSRRVERHRLEPVQPVVEEQQDRGERDLRDQLRRRLERQDVVDEADHEHQRRARRSGRRQLAAEAEDDRADEQADAAMATPPNSATGRCASDPRAAAPRSRAAMASSAADRDQASDRTAQRQTARGRVNMETGDCDRTIGSSIIAEAASHGTATVAAAGPRREAAAASARKQTSAQSRWPWLARPLWCRRRARRTRLEPRYVRDSGRRTRAACRARSRAARRGTRRRAARQSRSSAVDRCPVGNQIGERVAQNRLGPAAVELARVRQRGRHTRSARVSRNGHRASSEFAIVQRSVLTSRSSGRYEREVGRQQLAERRGRTRARRVARADARADRRPADAWQKRREIVLKEAVPAREPLEQRQVHEPGEARARASRCRSLRRARQQRERRVAAAAGPRRGRRSAASAARKPQVAGKHLVAAVAGQHDRDMLARQLRDEIGRNRRRIAERPVVMPDQTYRSARSPTAGRGTRCDRC